MGYALVLETRMGFLKLCNGVAWLNFLETTIIITNNYGLAIYFLE